MSICGGRQLRPNRFLASFFFFSWILASVTFGGVLRRQETRHRPRPAAAHEVRRSNRDKTPRRLTRHALARRARTRSAEFHGVMKHVKITNMWSQDATFVFLKVTRRLNYSFIDWYVLKMKLDGVCKLYYTSNYFLICLISVQTWCLFF